MNTKAAIFPTVFAIIMAIAGLGIPLPGNTEGTPWLKAIHQQTMPDGQVVNVDNIEFFLWGHKYTVVGKISQTSFTTYDWRDFPFYSMILATFAIIFGVIAIIASRDINIRIKGKERTIKFPKDVGTNIIGRNIRISIPMLLLIFATVTLAAGTIYLDYSARATIIPLLYGNNYMVETKLGFQFLEIGVVGFVVSIIMTRVNTIRRRKEQSVEDIEE